MMLFRYGKVSYFIKNNQIFRITLIALKCKTAYFELQNRRFYAPKEPILFFKGFVSSLYSIILNR